MDEPGRGTAGAVLGYPENGPYTATPARFGDTREVISDDSYGDGPTRRSISSLRGVVRSGNSGGPMVDSRGRVLGTVFAATTDGPAGGFAVPNDLVRLPWESDCLGRHGTLHKLTGPSLTFSKLTQRGGNIHRPRAVRTGRMPALPRRDRADRQAMDRGDRLRA